MSDEAAFLLRVSAFGFACTVVYWFLSQDPFGTMGFFVLGAGPGFMGLMLLLSGRGRVPGENPIDAFRRFAGVPKLDPRKRLNLGYENLGVLPTDTIAPFMIAIGIVLVILGLIFDYWVIVPGGMIVVWGVTRWYRLANREQAYGRLLAEQEGIGEAVPIGHEPHMTQPPD